MPGFERLPNFQVNVPGIEIADVGKTKFKVRVKPLRLYWVAAVLKILNHITEVTPNKVREHPAVMNLSSPMHEALVVGLLPEPGDKGAQQELLRQTHARVRRHLKRPHFQKAKPACTGLG